MSPIVARDENVVFLAGTSLFSILPLFQIRVLLVGKRKSYGVGS